MEVPRTDSRTEHVRSWPRMPSAAAVAQIYNLLYRRFTICRTWIFFQRVKSPSLLPRCGRIPRCSRTQRGRKRIARSVWSASSLLPLLCCVLTAHSAEPLQPNASLTGPVTFNKDIAPIIFQQCAGCHQPGQSAPFNLLSYADVKKRAKQVADVVE